MNKFTLLALLLGLVLTGCEKEEEILKSDLEGRFLCQILETERRENHFEETKYDLVLPVSISESTINIDGHAFLLEDNETEFVGIQSQVGFFKDIYTLSYSCDLDCIVIEIRSNLEEGGTLVKQYRGIRTDLSETNNVTQLNGVYNVSSSNYSLAAEIDTLLYGQKQVLVNPPATLYMNGELFSIGNCHSFYSSFRRSNHLDPSEYILRFQWEIGPKLGPGNRKEFSLLRSVKAGEPQTVHIVDKYRGRGV